MVTSTDIGNTTTGELGLDAEFSKIAALYDPPSQSLTEMVRQVANRLELDVCSIYVLEADRQHVCLAATMGLNQDSVGHVRMQISEGLAGLVVEQSKPVSVASASEHPRFKYFPEAGEERYSSFVGLPVTGSNGLQGVLTVQTIDARDFSRSELELIAAAAAALAPHVARCRLVEYAKTPTEPALTGTASRESSDSAN